MEICIKCLVFDYNVFRELVKNSIQADATEIKIIVDKKKKCLSISDNGHGMDGESRNMDDKLSLHRVPKRIANSVKDNCFGIGMLGFAKLGSEMIIRTRTNDSKTYILKMIEKEIADKNKQPVCEMDKAKEERKYAGTDVFIYKLKKRAIPTFDNLSKDLRNEFNPRLRKGVKICLIYNGRETEIKPNTYNGWPIHIPEDIGKTPCGIVEFRLYHPVKEEPKISIYTGDDRIKERIEEIEEFKEEPWTSGKICGEIRCDFLEPYVTTDRNDYDYGTEEFSEFVKTVKEAGKIVKSQIDEEESKRKKEADKSILEELKEIINSNDVLALFDELGLDTLDKPGAERKIKPIKKPDLGKISIYGYVTDINTGKPIKNVEIRCNNRINNAEDTIVSTDTSGFYLLEDLDTGIYYIVASNKDFHSKRRNKEYLKEGEYQEDFRLLPIEEEIKPRIRHKTGFNPEFTDDPDIFEWPFYNKLGSLYKEKMGTIYLREHFYNDYRTKLEYKFKNTKDRAEVIKAGLFDYCYKLIIKGIILLNKGLHYDSELEIYVNESELLDKIIQLQLEIEKLPPILS